MTEGMRGKSSEAGTCESKGTGGGGKRGGRGDSIMGYAEKRGVMLEK